MPLTTGTEAELSRIPVESAQVGSGRAVVNEMDAMDDREAAERRGRRWLMWSFVFCPCHLPVSMTVLGVVLGGSALGAIVARNTIAVGVAFGAVYAVGLAVGFRHLRVAQRGADCGSRSCRI